MKHITVFSIVVLALAFCMNAFGQSPVPAQTPAATQTPRVDARERHQQKRIGQGVKSGELTARETRRLERQEAKIKSDEMKAKSDGKVTKAERMKLNRELNRESKQIYRKKHNARVQK